jgi:hypothetical protein
LEPVIDEIKGNPMWLILGPANKCLDVKGESSENETPIILFDQHGKSNQRWMFTPDGQIVSMLDQNKCLDVSGGHATHGTPVILFDRHGGNNQKWKLTLDGAIISALHPNMCLTVGGPATNETPIVLSDRAISLKPNQIWTPRPTFDVGPRHPTEFDVGAPDGAEWASPIFTAEGRILCSTDESTRWICRFEISLPTALVGFGGTIDDPALADRVAKEFVNILREPGLGNPSVSILEFFPPASIQFSVNLRKGLYRHSSREDFIKSLESAAKYSIASVGL